MPLRLYGLEYVYFMFLCCLYLLDVGRDHKRATLIYWLVKGHLVVLLGVSCRSLGEKHGEIPFTLICLSQNIFHGTHFLFYSDNVSVHQNVKVMFIL